MSPRFAVWRFAAMALAVAAWAPGAHADARSEDMVRSFLNAVDARPDWSASAARVITEGADTLVEGLTVRREGEPFELRADQVRLTDLVPREGGGFRAARAAVTGFFLTAPTFGLAAPQANGTDLAVPNLFGIPFDPERPMLFSAKLYGALAQIETSGFTVPTLTARQSAAQTAGAETSPAGAVQAETTQTNLTITNLKNGIVERVSLGPTTIRSSGPDGEVRVGVGGAEGLRYDLDAIAHVFDPDRYRGGKGDGAWRPALGSIVYRDMSFSMPDGGEVAIARMSLSGFDVRQPETPFVPVLDRLIANPNMPEEEAARLGLDLIGLFRAMRIGEMSLEGLAVQGGAGDGGGSGGLDRFAVADLSSDGVEAITLQGLRVSGPEASVKVGSFEIAGIVFPDWNALKELVALTERAEAAGATAPPDPETQARLARLGFRMLPKVGRVALRDVAVEPAGTEGVRLDAYAVEMRDYVGAIPMSSTAELKGLVIAGSLLRTTPEAAAVFDGLGYDRLAIAGSGAGDYEPQSGRTTARTSLTVEDAATMELGYGVSGLTETWIDRMIDVAATAPDDDPTTLLPLLNELSLESVLLKVADRSIVDRGIRFAAQGQGVEPEMYRAQLQGAVPFLMTQAVPIPDLQLQLTQAVQAFLGGGRTIVLEARPAAPLPVSAILDAAQTAPQTLPDLLGVRIAVED